MGSELKKKESGRILDILENMWKADCEKEEKISQDRWRMKEIWQLDYVRKYGNSIGKDKNQKKPKENLPNRAARNKPSFSEIVNRNSTQENRNQSTSNEQQRCDHKKIHVTDMEENSTSCHNIRAMKKE